MLTTNYTYFLHIRILIGHLFRGGSWYGRNDTGSSNSLLRECRPGKWAFCDELLLREQTCRSPYTSHIEGIGWCAGHGFVSKHGHTSCWYLGRVRICCIAYGQWLHDFHNTVHPLAWGSPGRSRGVWVYLARLSSFLRGCLILKRRMYHTCSRYDTLRYPMGNTSFGAWEKPHEIALMRPFRIFLAIIIISHDYTEKQWILLHRLRE